MASEFETSGGERVVRALTFRDTKTGLFGSILALIALGALGGALNVLDLQPTFLSYLAVAVVAFMLITCAISVRESGIALVGLMLVGFWIMMTVAAPVLPLLSPNETTATFTNYVANTGSEFADAPPEVQEASKTLTSYEQLAAITGELPAPLVPLRDAAQAVVDTYVAENPVEEKNTAFMVEFEDRLHYLSVDAKGRDILSRIVWGAQRVLFWATLATVVAYVVGAFFGVAAGYLGGWADEVISFIANVMLSFPIMVLYIIIITNLGASGINIVLAVTFASAPGIMRIVRGLALDIRTRDYIAAAQTRGESSIYIMLVELLPNARGPLIVDACLRLGYTIIAIATLGFLGLGLPPPDPDWGAMLAESRDTAQFYPYTILYPAIAVSSLILGFNLLADGLRDISLRD